MTKKYHRNVKNESVHRDVVVQARKDWTDGTLGGWLKRTKKPKK